MFDAKLLTPIIVALVEAIKQLGIPSKLLPWISMLLGVSFNIMLSAAISTEIVLMGIIFGLSACGLYSGTKAVLK